MNILVRTAIAGALALGAAAANAAAFTDPASYDPTNAAATSGDIALLVQAVDGTGTTVGVYAFNTGVTLNQLMPSTTALKSGASLDTTTFTPYNATINLDGTTLSGFLSKYSADTITWELVGGQYTDGGYGQAVNNNTKAPGAAKAIFTSASAGTSVSSMTVNSNLQNILNGLEGDIKGGSFGDGSETTSANTATTAFYKYGVFSYQDGGALGASNAQTLYGITGNGSPGTVQSYILDTVTLTANSLTFGSSVPLPAAVWLLGSGLLGLLGVSRRRAA